MPPTLFGVLDGRTTPIYLESRYSFTNFEWARGKVYFKQGFDLPFNGTVIIDITEEVRGKVQFRNSTLRLSNDLRLALDASLTGSGFVDAQGNSIFLKNDWQPLPTERFVFTSDVTFRGVNSNVIDFSRAGTTGGISFAGPADYVYFIQLALGPLSGNNLHLRTFIPTELRFIECILRLGNKSLTLNSWNVRLYGENKITSSGKVQLQLPNNFFIEPYASLYVSPEITLSVKLIASFDTSSVLILDNTHLIYNPATTPQVFFQKSWAGGENKGRFVIRGRSSIEIPSGKIITITAPTDLSLEAGAVLTLRENSQLKIE